MVSSLSPCLVLPVPAAHYIGIREAIRTRLPGVPAASHGKAAHCMEWVFLLLAGASEVTWTTAMKASEGFSKTGPTAITIIGLVLSMIFLALALKNLPLGTAYTIWTGIGIVGTSILSVFLFNEAISPAQVICIILIATGIVGLRLLAE
jgi:quaternary ammonium compound-resistance protein SugE